MHEQLFNCDCIRCNSYARLLIDPIFALDSPVKECELSSPTSYFWYRKALDITDSIDEAGSFNPYIVCCLLAAWTIVCLGMFKGIKTSVKVTVQSGVTPKNDFTVEKAVLIK